MTKINIKEIKHGEYPLEKLIKIFTPYFRRMAYYITCDEAIRDELTQEGYISLWESIEKYDESRGASYFNYIIYSTKFAMLNYINDKRSTSKTIYIPQKQRKESNITTISMDRTINDYQAISGTIANEVEEDIEDEKIVPLRAYMKVLKKEHRDILEIKYQGYSDTDLAAMTGITKQRVGQIVKASIKKLQKEFGVPQVGIASKKHTKLSPKEIALRKKHNLL